MRHRPLLSAIVVAVVFALVIAACSSDDDGDENAPAPTRTSETPPGNEEATPPSAGQLPPEFMKCMAKRGFPIESPDEIHSAPQQVLQACFGSLHGGGGEP